MLYNITVIVDSNKKILLNQGEFMERKANINRKTGETDIEITLHLDGTGSNSINTGIGFFDHMLSSFAKHGLFDLKVSVKGDLEVDSHHTIEDTGIVLGQAIKKAIEDKNGWDY